MSELFTMTHRRDWFSGEHWTETNDIDLIRRMGFPDTVLSVLADTFFFEEYRDAKEIDTTYFEDIWISTDGDLWTPGKETEVVLLRYDEKINEVTAWFLHQPGNVGQPWSASYSAYYLDFRFDVASYRYSGAGSNLSGDKPFRLTGAIKTALLRAICEDQSAPLKIVQRSHPNHRERREQELNDWYTPEGDDDDSA